MSKNESNDYDDDNFSRMIKVFLFTYVTIIPKRKSMPVPKQRDRRSKSSLKNGCNEIMRPKYNKCMKMKRDFRLFPSL